MKRFWENFWELATELLLIAAVWGVVLYIVAKGQGHV